MEFSDVLRHFKGSQVAIARALGITEQAVSRWGRLNRVPMGRQYELQLLTGGTLKAGLSIPKPTTAVYEKNSCRQ